MVAELKQQSLSPESPPPSLADRLYKRIFEAIITGEVPGDVTLVASSLAKKFDVSVTPIREALLRLANEGLVKPIPRVGYMVEAMSEADIVDLFEARIGIERWAAGLAVQKMTPSEIEFLEDNLGRMDRAIDCGRTEDMVELDTAFHQFIAQASRNKTLFQVSQLIIQRTHRFRYACIRITEIARRTRDGHREIVEAFTQRKAAKVDRAVQAHLEDVKSKVSAYLRQLRHDSLQTNGASLNGLRSSKVV
jgi:DNA-binding GntR family transcriptional regulator